MSERNQLLVRVKGRKAHNILYLNDGIYGAMAEWRDIGPVKRLEIMRPSGDAVTDQVDAFTVFGPTCDSLDRLPDTGRIATHDPRRGLHPDFWHGRLFQRHLHAL